LTLAKNPAEAIPLASITRYDPAVSRTARTRALLMSIALLLIGAAFAWSLLPSRQWAQELGAWVHGLGAYGPIAFFLLVIVGVTALVPASALTFAAGLTFGFAAFPLVLVAATIGAACAFLIARHIATDKVKHLVENLPRSKAIYKAVSDGGWKMVFLLRLSPIMPFCVLNYVLGATQLRFWPFLTASFVGIIPAVALYAYLGALGNAVIAGKAIGMVRWLLLLLGLAATLVVVFHVVRKARAELEKPAPDPP
jgi:uncharacterized membrane protein YdjX (TVP38/TMEM64 family)